MLAANDKAFIMAIDDQKKQTLYVLYHDREKNVKLKKLLSSNNIVQFIIKCGSETKKEQDE
jgi:hypothetical protein